MKLSVRKECLCYIFTILSILVIAMFIRSTLWNYLEHLPYTFTIKFKTLPIDITPGNLQFIYGSGTPPGDGSIPKGDSITPKQSGDNWTVQLTTEVPADADAWYLYITSSIQNDKSKLKTLFYQTPTVKTLTQVQPLGDGIVVPFKTDDITKGVATLILDNAPQ